MKNNHELRFDVTLEIKARLERIAGLTGLSTQDFARSCCLLGLEMSELALIEGHEIYFTGMPNSKIKRLRLDSGKIPTTSGKKSVTV